MKAPDVRVASTEKTLPVMDATEARVSPADGGQARRVSSAVALALLEILRVRDLPEEVFAEEDLTETMPRRLGLNDVVDAQIRRYRAEARRGRRVPAAEVQDLFQLVLRRADARDIFYLAGRRLAGRHSPGSRLVRALPKRAAVVVGGQRARARVSRLFGSGATSLGGEPFAVGGRDLITVRGDPSGAACALYTGLFDEILERHTGEPLRVIHRECESRGQPRCVWGLSE